MSRPPAGRIERFDLLLIATVVGLAGLTAATLMVPPLRLRILAPALDLSLDTMALVITGSIALLAWVRYRERHEAFALFQSAAFLSLAIANLHAVFETIGPDGRSVLSMAEPGQGHLYVSLVARMLTAMFLVVGGFVALRGRSPGHPRLLLAGSALLSIAAIAVVERLGAGLTDLITQVPPAAGAFEPQVPSVTPIGAAVQALNAGLFGLAALVCRQLWRRDRSIGDAYVTVGLVLAAFAQLHGVITPNTHPGPVASGDLLRFGFYLSLLLAVEAEARAMMSKLQLANQTLERLRESEVERATLEERALLSRELHDGLAQDLWLAKLKVGRLSGLDLDPEARKLVGEIGGAVELGLTEARQAVMALRIAAESEDTFGDLMAKYAQDFEDRFGLRVEFECADDLPRLPARTQAEFLRIAQEALTNARRHADATIVRVRADTEATRFRLSVMDNGRGFDQSAVQSTSFGLAAMRERAALIGGELQVITGPGNGTRVQVTAPLA